VPEAQGKWDFFHPSYWKEAGSQKENSLEIISESVSVLPVSKNSFVP